MKLDTFIDAQIFYSVERKKTKTKKTNDNIYSFPFYCLNNYCFSFPSNHMI